MTLLFHTHVPAEVLQQIVCELDPISLIALSQTSKSWRAFINPTRHDYIQRLLALELMPEYGGMVPLFNEFLQKLSPPWDSSEWDSNKYACCCCMKLRTHMMFDNHAILRRPYRKPPPGSVEASKASLTDWEPLEPSVRWRRIQERAAQAREEQRRWARVAYWKKDNALTNPPGQQFARESGPNQDTEHEVQMYLTGTARQKRRCIECQHRLNIWSGPHTRRDSSDNAPAVISRQALFLSQWDRHFPGLVEPPPPEKRPRYWRTLSESAAGLLLSLYLIRCPFCETWQRDSAFREWRLHEWGFRPRRRTSNDPHICNRCHLETRRDPDLLAQELSAGALTMFREHRDYVLSQLQFGWRFIYDDFNNAKNAATSLAEHKALADEILGGLKWLGRRRTSVALAPSNLPDLRRRFELYKDFIYSDKVDPDKRAEILQSWFKLWVEDYEKAEQMYYWLSKQIAWLEGDANAVLNYVLERDPYRI
jgi:hypothetical protein